MRYLQAMLSDFAQKPLAEKARLLDAYLVEKLARDLAEIHNLYDLDQFKVLLTSVFQAADRKINNVVDSLIGSQASTIIAIPDQWHKLPDDKLWLILQHLTPGEFLLLGKVNRQFRGLTQNDYFWQQYAKLYKFKSRNKKDFINRFIVFFGKTSSEIDSFIHAIVQGDEKTVAALFQCNAIQTYLNQERFISIYFFIVRNSSLAIFRVIEKYFSHKHDLVKDIYKVLALHFALKAGRQDICGYLRSSISSSPLTQEISRILLNNPLHLAAANGDIESLEHFINKQYSVNRIANSFTPLHMAALSGQQAAVEWLLKNGASINLETEKHETPLALALTMGHDGLAKFLLEKGAVLSANEKQTVLKKAILCGCVQTIRYLRENGHDIASLDDQGNSYLHLAALAIRNSERVVSQFIRFRLAVNQKNKNGQTPLHFAALKGHAGAIKELLSHGADIHGGDVSGNTAMHYAARGNDPETVKLLLEKGLSAVQPNQNGETPLLLAVQCGHTAVAQLLLDSINFRVQTSRQSRHRICERLWTVLNTEKGVVKSYEAFVLEEAQHDPMGLALDIGDFKVALVKDNTIDALAWHVNMRRMLVKRLLSASAECFTEYRNSLPKMQANAGETEFVLNQALRELGLTIQVMQDENRKGNLPPRLAMAFYELSYAITDSKKQVVEKLKAIEEFKAKILPSWWQTFGKILACIFWVAVGISVGSTIGFWAIAGCVWFGTLNLATMSTFASNIMLGSLAATMATGGISAGALSSCWLFKPSPEEKLAKRLAKNADLLVDKPSIDRNSLTLPLKQQTTSTLIP